MAELKVALKLTADGSALVGEVRLARAELDKLGTAANDAGASLRQATDGGAVTSLDAHRRSTRGLTEDMNGAAQQARSLQRAAEEAAASHRQAAAGVSAHGAAVESFGRSAAGANDNVTGLNSAVGLLSGGLKVLGGLFALDRIRAFAGELISAAAQAQQLERRLASLLGTGSALAETQAWLSTTADRLGQDTVVMTDSYARFLNLAKSGLLTVQQARDLTEGMANAQVKFAADAGRMGDVMYGLSQAFASPIVHMEELNQVVEPLPGLLLDLDKAAGLPSGGFRKLVAEGRVTSELFRDTLAKALKGYAGEAEKAAGTVDAAYLRMQNARRRFMAEGGKPLAEGWTNLLDFGAGAFDAANRAAQYFNKGANQNALTAETMLLDQLLERRNQLEAQRKRYEGGAGGVYAKRNLEQTDRALAGTEAEIDAALAKIAKLRAALNDAGDGWAEMWGAASVGPDPAAMALDKLAGRLGLAAEAVDLVVTKNGLLTKSEIELRTHTDTLAQVLGRTPEELKKLGISAADAGFILEQLREKLSPVAAAIADLNRETAALGVAPKFRGLYQALDEAERAKGRKLTDDEAADLSIAYRKNQTANSGEQVRLMREAADAAQALARAQSSGDPAAIAHARANLKVAEALRDGVIVQSDKAAYSQQVLRQEMAGLAGQAGEAATVSSRQARQMLEMAEATRRGGAAVAETTLKHQIENETLKVGAGAHGELAKRLTEEARARRELAAAQFDRDIDMQIAAAKALAGAEAQGAKAVADATVKNQVAAQIEREGVAADSERAKAIAAKTEELAKWQQQQGYERAVRAKDDEVKLLQLELSLQGEGETIRERTLELARAELEIRRDFPTKTDEEVAALLRKHDAALRIRADIQRQRGLWDEVARLGERAFDRVGSAITEAFAQGKMSALSWGNITRAVMSEVIQAALQLAVINPLKNWVTGGSAPSIWSAMGGGGAAPVAGGGVTGTLTSAATNWGMSKAGGWALDKLGFGAGAGGIGLVDKVGMSLGFGAPTIASGAMTAGYVAPTVMVNGTAVPVSAEVAAGQVAMLEAANAGTTGTLGAGVSSSLPALSSLLTAAGAGAFGGMFGGMLGTAANSKAVGGLSGAALGLGATGAYAAIMGMSAVGGPIGLAIGAIVGGIMGLLGTAKKSSGPNGGANVRFDNGVAGLGASGADNGGDVGKAKAAAEAASATFNAIVKLGGGSVNKSMTGAVGGIEFNDQKGTWTSLVSDIRKDFSSVEEAVSDFAKRMVEALTKDGNLSPLDQDVATALKNSKATSPDKLLEDIGFAKTFRSTFDQMRGALNPLDNQIKEWTTASKELGEQVKTALIDWRAKAVELKLATEAELNPALLKSMDALMGIGPAVEPLRGMAAVTKRAEIEFEAFKPALEEFGLTAAQVADKLKQYVEKAKSNALEVVGETQRVGTLSLVSTMDPAFRMGAGDLLKNLGLKPETLEPLRLALDTLDITARGGAASTRHVVSAQAALNQALLDGLVSGEQYQQLITAISTSWASSQAASNAMLRGRLTLAQLINPADKPGGGDLLRLAGIDPAKLQGRLEAPLDSFLAAARAGTASAAQLRSMWAGFDAELRAGTITVDAYSQALSILSDAWQEQTQQLEQVAAAQSEIVAGWSRVANEALAAVNSLRMDAQLSTLGPKARVDEGERLVEDAYRRFTSAANDNERQQAWSDFNSLWRPYLEASREYYADQVEYNRRYEKVIQEQQAIASYAGAQASMAQQQLDVARQSLETLRSINAKSGGGSAGGGGVPASNSGPGEYYGAPGGRYKWVQHPDGNWSIEQYATGAAALGQGVYHRPTRFRELGEAGPEAIMPLANVGGRLGIHAVLPSTAPTDLGPVVAAVGGATGAIMEVGNLIAGRLDILIDGVDELRREVAEQRRVNRDLVTQLERRAA